MRLSRLMAWVWVVAGGQLCGGALAVNVDLVTVGNPGNAGDTRYTVNGVTGFGSVGYTYRMGKFDVTAGQYCAFLNAVAATDTYGLYNTYMDYDAIPSLWGCNIKRTGDSGGYSYSVASEWANRPVNYVSWGDAARFVNWMANGQRSGLQDASTTEDGTYTLNGATSNAALMAMTRKTNATFVIPTEDEWYKAAYYDPSKSGGAGYWDYATRSNTAPSNVLSATGINNANYYDGTKQPYPAGFTMGEPYYRTEVGAFAGSPSGYGTFDQAGNVYQWNEAVIYGRRGYRGGSFSLTRPSSDMLAWHRHQLDPAVEANDVGFRVALVPEPATLSLLALGGLALVRWNRAAT